MFGYKIQVNFSQIAHLAVAKIELKALWKTNRLTTTCYYLPKKKVSIKCFFENHVKVCLYVLYKWYFPPNLHLHRNNVVDQ